ncbi:hypothetical protein FJTKL_08156 [Diaporthe vaccinii]|uniref:Uncharacterized protein n=1 Tax=Diaporthe vaccinii TaxID=105482 RepID=A0ABR4ESS9_9PEZI
MRDKDTPELSLKNKTGRISLSHRKEITPEDTAHGSRPPYFLKTPKTLAFNLSARPLCVASSPSSLWARWTLPSPPLPVWWSWLSVEGRTAASGTTSLSVRGAAALVSEMLAAPEK